MLKTIAAAASLMALPLVAFAEGDAEKGERVFRKCMACHAVGPDAQNRVGPSLNGIIDSSVASVPGFDYSAVLAEMGSDGKIWTHDELDAFLERPRDYAKGTKMAFPGLRSEDERADVIAYLATFEEEGT